MSLPKFTLIIGRNNVGKSSAYAPLLLLKQTLNARDPRTALLGRGPLVDVGPFSDFANGHDASQIITFRLSLDTRGLNGPALDRMPGAIQTSFQSTNGVDTFVSRQRVEDKAGDSLITRSRKAPDGPFSFNSPLLPSASSTGRPYREITKVRQAFRDEQPQNFIFNSYGGLFLPQTVRQDPERWEAVRDWYNAAYLVFDTQTVANAALLRFLHSISYLGPLRSLPRRTYRIGAESPEEVGISGEHAPELLFRHADQSHANAVNIWLQRLGYGKLQFDAVGSEYFQAQLVDTSGLVVNLADTGVGLSQVIPLLVQGALSEPGSTMISQQPEIHLNPAQQSLVADFLISRANDGVRVLVETHSEHVLMRLRRRIAEGVIDAEDVSIVYVEATGSGSSLREVPVGEMGEITRQDWPIGFFEDQLEESFALAAAQSVRNKRRET